MTRFLAAALLATSSSLAFAETLTLPAPISAVDIYPDGVMIERGATAPLSAGSHTLILTDLPKNWDTQTLSLNISPNAEVTGLSLHSDAEDAAVRSAIDALKTAQEKIEQEMVAAREAHATATAEFEMVERFLNAPDLFASREDASTFWTFLVERHAALTPTLASFRATLDDLHDRRDEIDAQIADLTPRQTTWQIEATVEVLTAGEVSLQATYYSPQASWRTSYEVAMTTQADAPEALMTVEHGADIFQNTGEDWDGVETRLHANPAQRPIYAPALFTWHISPQADLVRLGEEKALGATLDVAEDEAFAPVPRAAQARVATSAYNATYILDAPLTLASNKEETQMVVLERGTVEADLWVQTTAETSNEAVLMAGLESPLAAVGLPGPAKFYRDGALIGRGQMPALIPGAVMELPFGADPLVEVSRRIDADQAGDRGFIARSNTQTRRAITTVTNNHAFAMPLRALEATPVPLHEDIELTIQRGSTPFDAVDYLGQKGVNLWTPEIGAGQTLTLTFGYQLSWPENMNVSF